MKSLSIPDRYKPSKKVLWALLPAFLLAGGALIFATTDDNSNSERQRSALAIATQKGVSHDSDEDGLADWEEELWGTDPEDHDTDNDGTSDGEEVENSRDPLTPGPNDALTQTELAYTYVGKDEGGSTEPPNLTNATFQNFLSIAAFGAQKEEDGGSLTQDDLDRFVSSITDDVSQDSYGGYAVEDLKIVSDPTTANIELYAEQITELTKSFTSTEAINPLGVVGQAAQNNDPEPLEDLSITQTTYVNLASGLLNIPVPEELSRSHLRLINSFQKMGNAVTDMKYILSDPVRGLIGTEEYRKTSEENQAAANTLLDELSAKLSG